MIGTGKTIEQQLRMDIRPRTLRVVCAVDFLAAGRWVFERLTGPVERVFAFWVRWQACKMAALAIQNQDKTDCIPLLWSMTVFFESYMWVGSEGTHADFGPKEPVELKEVGQ
jgi:hypothetical protein